MGLLRCGPVETLALLRPAPPPPGRRVLARLVRRRGRSSRSGRWPADLRLLASWPARLSGRAAAHRNVRHEHRRHPGAGHHRACRHNSPAACHRHRQGVRRAPRPAATSASKMSSSASSDVRSCRCAATRSRNTEQSMRRSHVVYPSQLRDVGHRADVQSCHVAYPTGGGCRACVAMTRCALKRPLLRRSERSPPSRRPRGTYRPEPTRRDHFNLVSEGGRL